VLGACAWRAVVDVVAGGVLAVVLLLAGAVVVGVGSARRAGSLLREGSPEATTPATIATITRNAYVSQRVRIGGRS
jgi:hypothetical protein